MQKKVCEREFGNNDAIFGKDACYNQCQLLKLQEKYVIMGMEQLRREPNSNWKRKFSCTRFECKLKETRHLLGWFLRG